MDVNSPHIFRIRLVEVKMRFDGLSRRQRSTITKFMHEKVAVRTALLWALTAMLIGFVLGAVPAGFLFIHGLLGLLGIGP